MQFEYTARSTPQQNSMVETGFSYILNKARALLIEANIPYLTRYKIMHEAIITATKLDNLAIVELDGKFKTRYEHFEGKLPKFVKHLRVWGEAGVVKIKSKIAPKLKDKGVTTMFAGYTNNHDGDCYKMWEPKLHNIYITRDVIWLKRMYFSKNDNKEE